ncbi:MAG TPA: sigma-70 family RNA polymerase sigma factor [Dermatophilaceae bacterium]|nr:sigma-70 family RNA polymerase sigma factor [Dermatophilaceae bacterium]
MTTVSRDEQRPPAAADAARPEPLDWVHALTSSGPDQVSAMRELHRLMLRAARHQVWRMRGVLPDASPGTVDVIANQAADEAMTTLLGKLHTFEGRSRFSTWAFKFAILQAASDVRRLQWRHREVELRDLDRPAAPHDSPEAQAEGSALAAAVADAMHTVLTPYQRRIAVALLVDDVPIDVLAERLGSTRGALYKTVHDARGRLRTELTARGYLPATPGSTTAGSSTTASPMAGTS